MEREKLEALLIDYIDGKLNPEERLSVEEMHLRNPETYLLYAQLKEVIQAMQESSQMEPTRQLRADFDKLLQEELGQRKRGKAVAFMPAYFKVAAAVALIAVAGAVGFWIKEHQEHTAAIAEMRAEMEATKRQMMSLLHNEGSASQRLMGATVAFNDITHADNDIIKALVKTMNHDENSNVRLAALEALAKFKDQPHVRKYLIESLDTQKDPLVQIALIRLLVDMHEKGAMQKLEEITTDENLLPAVKDEAHVGILKMS